MNRIKSDFLFASSTIFSGIGSVLCLNGQVYDYNRSEHPDELATAVDWRIVGQDITDALSVESSTIENRSQADE